jgi:hypothetical protein
MKVREAKTSVGLYALIPYGFSGILEFLSVKGISLLSPKPIKHRERFGISRLG